MALPADPRVWRGLALVFATLSALFALCFYLWRLSLVLVLGLALIVVIDKLILDYRHRLERFGVTGLKRKLYGGCTLFLWLTGAYLLVGNSLDDIAPSLSQLANLGDDGLETYARAAAPYVPRVLHRALLGETALSSYRELLDHILGATLQATPGLALDAVLVIPLLIYAHLRRRRSVASVIEEAAPAPYRAGIARAARAIEERLRDFFAAKVMQNTVVGSLCCLGFFVGGVKGWLLLGSLAGFLNLVPYIGPALGAVPPLVLSLLIGDPVAALAALVTVVVVRVIDDVYLTPFLIASRVDIDPLVNLLLILGGAQLLGILGMMFAVPIYIIYWTVLAETRVQLEARAGEGS